MNFAVFHLHGAPYKMAGEKWRVGIWREKYLAGKSNRFGGRLACLLAVAASSLERSAVLAVLLLLLIIYPWTIVVEETILLLPSMIC